EKRVAAGMWMAHSRRRRGDRRAYTTAVVADRFRLGPAVVIVAPQWRAGSFFKFNTYRPQIKPGRLSHSVITTKIQNAALSSFNDRVMWGLNLCIAIIGHAKASFAGKTQDSEAGGLERALS